MWAPEAQLALRWGMLSDGEAAKPQSRGSRVALVCKAEFTLTLHW